MVVAEFVCGSGIRTSVPKSSELQFAGRFPRVGSRRRPRDPRLKSKGKGRERSALVVLVWLK